jgi:predicted AAA+ superfamily ATPase
MLVKGKILPKNPDFELIKEDLKEYMTYGGYPAVVIARTHEQKVGALRDIIERMYDKDFVYYLNQKLLLDFKQMFQALVLNITSLFKME